MNRIFMKIFKQVTIMLFILMMMAGISFGIEYNLRADTTTKTMPGGVVITMWGFALDSAFGAEDGEVNVPGPILTVPPGDPNLILHLDNNLEVPISIVIPGQITAMTPVKFTDGQGRQRVRSFTHETAPGNITPVDYTWGNMRAGTYLYHSGTHPAVQVQMGLYGCLKKDESPSLNLGSAGSYNVFIFEDAFQSNSSSEGNIAAGRNARWTNYNAATALAGPSAKVVVGGSITNWDQGSVGGGSGDIFVGKNANLNLVDYANLTTDGQSEVDFSAARAYLRGASGYWSSLPANGSTTVNPGIIALTGSDPNLNIFSVSGSDLSSIFVLEITAPAGSTALVNINGTSIQMPNFLIVLNNIDRNHILYNLFEATSLSLDSQQVEGSILAPLSAVNFDNGNIKGTLIGRSLGTLSEPSTGDAESYPFSGNLPVLDPVAYHGVFYNTEVILCFSEIDPALHNAIATNDYGPGKSMASTINYEPKYFLINGKPYTSGQAPLSAGEPNDRVLLRLLNAGLETHVPVLNDFYGTLVAEDGYQYKYAKEQYSIILPAAQTKDVIIIPRTEGLYPVYDRRLRLTDANASSGGMLAYLNVSTAESAAVQPLADEDSSVSGDLDGDGDVDRDDVRIFRRHWRHRRSYHEDCPADLDGDADVDRQDFIIIVEQFTETGLSKEQSTDTPNKQVRKLRRIDRQLR